MYDIIKKEFTKIIKENGLESEEVVIPGGSAFSRGGYMVLIKLTYEAVTKPKLGDLSALLYDYELLHDYLVLSTMEGYSLYPFPRYFWHRSGRPLAIEERMQIRAIHYGSPLIWIPVITSWVAVKIVQPLV